MTRFYFSNSEAAAVNPVPSGAPWNFLSESTRWRLLPFKRASESLSGGTQIGPWLPGLTAQDRVYVSDRLAGGSISGTLTCFLQAREFNAEDNCRPQIEVYVVSDDGQFLRGILLPWAVYGSGTEYLESGFRSVQFALGQALTPMTITPGDRLVIVIGHTDVGGTTPEAQVNYGAASAGVDADQNETETGARVGWVEFSQDLEFLEPTNPHDDGGITTIADPEEPPDPTIPPTETPPPYPEYLRVDLDKPPTAIPHEGVEELIHLMRVDGNPTDGFTYKVHRVLSVDYQQMEWWYHRKGGCGSFRMLTRDQNMLVDFSDRTAYAWEIWVRVKLPTESSYRVWYRGEIKTVTQEHANVDSMTDVRGMGYIEQLQKLYISRKFPAGMTVSQMLETILDEYVFDGKTRIRRADAGDVTNQGLTASNYTTRGETYFECSVYRALKYLAELEGDIEWGVDAEAQFYWKKELSTPGKAFFLDNDSVYTRAGAYTSELTTKVRLEGSLEGGRELLRVIRDVTDPTDPIHKQEYSMVTEQPWVCHPDDAQHWCDNILTLRRRMQHWRLIRWKEVTARLEQNHPVAGLRRVLWRDDSDVTNPFSEYEIDKIHYIKGGLKIVGELKEKGRSKGHSEMRSATLSAEVWLGNTPRTAGEDLNQLQDEIDALKGKWKQHRTPNEVTNTLQLLNTTTARVPGERRFLRTDVTQPIDVTNIDVTNKIVSQWTPDKPVGVPVYWDGEQWVKESNRYTYWPNLPDRGLFPGQHATLLTDITQSLGTTWMWNGQSWVQLSGSVSSVDPLVLTERAAKPSAPDADTQAVYAYPDGLYAQDDLGREIGPIRDAPNHWRSVIAWQKLAGEALQVLIGARTNMTTEGTESAANDSDGQYLRYISAGGAGSDAGWLDLTGRVSRENLPIFDAIIKLHTDFTDARIWAGMTSGDLMAATNPGTISVAAFRCDKNAGETTIKCVVADGTGSFTVFDSLVVAALDTKYHLRIDMNRDTGKVFFYINRILVATAIAANGDFLPAAATLMGAQVEVRKVVLGGIGKAIKIQKVAIEYNG